MRFDTRFYVGLAPAHAKPTPDGKEMSEARWVAPVDALGDFAEGTFSSLPSRRSSIWRSCATPATPMRCSRRPRDVPSCR